MALLAIERPQAVTRMRCAEDLFALAGLMVLMTAETGLMRELLEEHQIVASSILSVTVQGAPASIYVCRFLAMS
jgi:hypothetical protein